MSKCVRDLKRLWSLVNLQQLHLDSPRSRGIVPLVDRDDLKIRVGGRDIALQIR
jgi:hypothetical protein